MEPIKLLYKLNDSSDSPYHCITGLWEVPEMRNCDIPRPFMFQISNEENSISNWNKVIKDADGKDLNWFLSIPCRGKTFCFNGTPKPIRKYHSSIDTQGVAIDEAYNFRWEDFEIKGSDVLYD